ncbi:MAG: nucleotidyltransferase domain-containing protein [Alphaproteobacteria bacterium]
MTGLTFHSTVSPEMTAEIEQALSGIEATHDVRILFAIESGSRAWGFPSPDSDYDARFVYAHRRDWYLSLTPGRDVIELPIEDELDINGWDIRKALNLLLKPNPVLLEWLSSPIRYRWDDDACAALLDLAQRVTHGPACLHHYLSLGQRQWDVYVEGRDQVSLKKYFYILRPAMAIRWMRMHPDRQPPMNLQALMAELDLPKDKLSELDDLLARKAQTRELGEAARLSSLDAFIQQDFDWARQAVPGLKATSKGLEAEATRLFQSLINWPETQ